MKTISWLHISDLHLSNDTLVQWEKIERTFLNKIENLVRTTKINAIFFTGDLMDRGDYFENKELVQKLSIFIDKLSKITSLERDHFFIVPGNHDMVRKDLPLVETSDKANNIFTSNIGIELKDDYLSVLNNYNNYIDNGFPHIHIKDSLFSVNLLELENPSIGFSFYNSKVKALIVGFNSSWNDIGDDNTRKKDLKVSRYQIDEINKSIVDVTRNNRIDIAILLMHHNPFRWIDNADRDYLLRNLSINMDFVLFGHDHSGPLGSFEISNESFEQKIICLESGALYENTEDYLHFCINYVDIEKSCFNKKYFHYEKRNKEFELDTLAKNCNVELKYEKNSTILNSKKNNDIITMNNIISGISTVDKNILHFDKYYESIIDQGRVMTKYLYHDFRGSCYYIDLINSKEYSIDDVTNTVEMDYLKAYFDTEDFKKLFLNSSNKLNLVSLGTGDGRKESSIISELIENYKIDFYPIDFSVYLLKYVLYISYQTFLKNTLNQDSLNIYPLNIDFTLERVDYLIKDQNAPTLFLLLGGTIGNLYNEYDLFFNLIHSMKPNDLLILGFMTDKNERGSFKNYGSMIDNRFVLNPFSMLQGESIRVDQNIIEAETYKLSNVPNTKSFVNYSKLSKKDSSNIVLAHSNRYLKYEMLKYISAFDKSVMIVDEKEYFRDNLGYNLYTIKKK